MSMQPPIALMKKPKFVIADDISDDFLRIPPFPGAVITSLAGERSPESQLEPADLASLTDLLRHVRVGGTYWGAQPVLPEAYVLCDQLELAAQDNEELAGLPVIAWPTSVCDPWHMFSGARALIVERIDERCAVAAALSVPVWIVDAEKRSFRPGDDAARAALEQLMAPRSWVNPFDGSPMNVGDAIKLCGFWRSLIDSNRDIAGGLGFAFWKQENVAPLLWNGTDNFRFAQSESELATQGPVAIWRSKASNQALQALERRGRDLIEVEDGFLRSSGLGADCVPPLSIIVDRIGAYFDPSRPSELEQLLQDGQFDAELIDRARALRTIIVEAGLGKYERSDLILDRPGGAQHHILVTGQVENDRSVIEGGGGLVSNLELLRRVRAAEPQAFIIYKPHPDVLAGHRAGHVDEKSALEFADMIARDQAIAPLLAMVDAVHVNTSLTGFEALLRGKPVTTYGVPFYAGWGLTVDRGQLPARRSSKRTLDELVAATLIVYPRYLDPVSGLPCPAEIAVQRLAGGNVEQGGIVVKLRRWQGAITRQVRRFVR